MDTGVQRAGSGNPENLPAAVSLLYKTALELISTKAALSEVLSCLCKLMEQQFPGLVCSVLILDSDGVTLRHGAAPSLPDEYIRAIDGARIGPAVGSCGTSAYRKEPVVVTSVATDPLWRNYRHLALPHALQACWSTPIFSRAGAVLGTFAVYYREPRGPENDHLQFVQSATHLAGIAIEREQAEAELQAVETRYRALVEHIPAITYIADFGVCGSWHFVSPQIQSILGFTPEEWLANSSNWVNQLHPEDRDRALAAESRFSERGGLFRSEYRMSARDGRTLWFRDEARLLHAADRNAKPRMQGVMYDITEYKQLEEQLRQSQKMEAVGKLAGGVAHDFNNLLMIIEGHSDRLLGLVSQSEPAYKDAFEIKEAAGRATSLTRQLLAFSRKQVLRPAVLDVNRVVRESSRMLERLIGENIAVEVVTDASLWPVKADRGQIEQVILNLTLNARDAMEHGGKLTLTTRNSEVDEASAAEHACAGKFVVLEVSDTGAGMDEETQAHIFEPFFSTKELGKGTGLGLASVYGIAKQSGGWISFRSRLGHGTTFSLYLPAACEEPAPSKEPKAPSRKTKGHETILVVEDEAEIRDLVSQYLQQNGYTVLHANDGRDALQIAKSYKGLIHLTVTDVVMPQIGGHELAQQLRQLRPRTKVLFTSGYPDPAALNDETSGETAFILQKPFSLNTLAGKIRELLDTPGPSGLPLSKTKAGEAKK